MQETDDLYIEHDKINAPFLLAASFNGIIQFAGSYVISGILYWKFTPKTKVQNLLEQLRTKTEPHIPAKDLFEATEAFWQQLSKARNGRK